MRRWLTFLILVGAILAASGEIGSLWRMRTSADRVGYGQPNGETQWAWLGPKAPWPKWAPIPAGVDLEVQAAFEATSTQPATGFGTITHRAPAFQVQRDYVRVLEESGWKALPTWAVIALPEIPRRDAKFCYVEATKGIRTLRLAVSDAKNTGVTRLHWFEGTPPAIRLKANEGFCDPG